MKLAIQKLASVILLALGTWTIAGEQAAPQPQVYDLTAVIQRTLAANPDLKVAAQDVNLEKARLDEAKGHLLPQITGQMGVLQLERAPAFTMPGIGNVVFGQSDNSLANISLLWPVNSSGQIENMIKASRYGVEASLLGEKRSRQEIVAEASVAYYQALSAGQMIAVMQQQITMLKEAVRVSTALHDQGMVAKLDVLRPNTDLALAQTTLIQAENSARLALANLKRIMNLPATTEITVTPQEETAAMPTDLPLAIKTALAQRPEVQQLRMFQQAARAQQASAAAQGKPHLGLQTQYDLSRPSTYPETGNWSVGLVLQQSIFDGGIARAQAKQAEAQEKSLEAKEESLTAGITAQVTNALLTLQAADDRVASTTLGVTTAEEASRFAEVSYKNQVVAMADVLSAQTALTNARVQHTLAGFDKQMALVQYTLALGSLPTESKAGQPAK